MDEVVRRIKVSTETHVRVHTAELPAQVVGLSARDALLVTKEPLGNPGDILELYLPVVGKREIEITAGIGKAERVESACVTIVEFIVIDRKVRAAVNDLLRLLLAGDGGGARKHPRVIYDVPCRYGPTGQLHGRLEEISFSGLSIRVDERMLPDLDIQVVVPDYASSDNLSLSGKVVHQRLAKEGGYHTGISFAELPVRQRAQVARLLADLLCR